MGGNDSIPSEKLAQIAEKGLDAIDATSLGDNDSRNSLQPGGAKCGAHAARDEKIRTILDALPHLPRGAIEIIYQTVVAFRV